MEQGNIHNVVRVLRVEMIKAQRSKTIDGNIYLFISCVFSGSFLFQKLSLSCVNLCCRDVLSLACGNPFNSKSSAQNSIETELSTNLIALFVDQDDELVELMLALLLLFQELHK